MKLFLLMKMISRSGWSGSTEPPGRVTCVVAVVTFRNGFICMYTGTPAVKVVTSLQYVLLQRALLCQWKLLLWRSEFSIQARCPWWQKWNCYMASKLNTHLEFILHFPFSPPLNFSNLFSSPFSSNLGSNVKDEIWDGDVWYLWIFVLKPNERKQVTCLHLYLCSHCEARWAAGVFPFTVPGSERERWYGSGQTQSIVGEADITLTTQM